MNRTKFVLSLVIAFSLALTFVAVPAAPVSRAQSVITVAFAQEPDTLNWMYSNMTFSKAATTLIHGTLWHYSDTLEAIPVLIDEIPTVENGGISEDFMTYTLRLKPGLLWSDGEALNADDVVFTYEMIGAFENNFLQAQGIRDVFGSVEKLDDLTVRVTFTEPSPAPELMASVQRLFIFPEHVWRPCYEADGTLENCPENQNPTVFSGAYRLTEWRRGEALTFEANDNYVFGRPPIDVIVIRVFPDPESAFAAMGAGQVEIVTNLGPADGPRVQALSPDINVVTVFGGYIEGLYLNIRPEDREDAGRPGHPALKDVRVRQALRLGIDRRAIINDLLGGAGEATDSIYAGSPFENPDLGFVEYDPEAAATLLDEAGWVDSNGDGTRDKDGVELVLRYGTTTAAFRRDIQAVIQQQLALIGVGIQLENFPATEFFGSWANNGITATGEFDIGEWAQSTALTTSYNETVNDGAACSQVVSADNPSGTNNTGFCNEEMDELARLAVTSSDRDEVVAALNRIQEIWRDEVPNIILFPRGDVFAYNGARFAGEITIGSLDGNMWFDVHNWQLR
jgi:peptide/nickel transport system substrate-binding protein